MISVTPEARARAHIDAMPAQAGWDAMPAQAGWIVQDRGRLNLHAGPGVAVREVPTPASSPW